MLNVDPPTYIEIIITLFIIIFSGEDTEDLRHLDFTPALCGGDFILVKGDPLTLVLMIFKNVAFK